MKSLFYILTIILGLAGAYLAYDNTNKIKAQQEKTAILVGQKNNVIDSTETEQKTLDGLNTDISYTKQTIADTNASLESAQAKTASLQKTLVKYEAQLEDIQRELDNYEALQTQLASALGEVGVSDVSEIPNKIENLKSEVKDKKRQLEDLELIVEKLENKVESATADKSSVDQRLATIRRNVAQNGTSATVTSVNTEWGFVVINKGASNFPIKDDSELLVQRGGRYVGRLKVATLEENQTICDIDTKSFVGSSYVRPGDSVILKDAVSQ